MHQRILAIAIGAWLGLHIGFGYIAAPVLFAHLEKMQAGNIAGILFHFVNWVGIIVWLATYLAIKKQRQYLNFYPRRIEIIIPLVILLVINEFLISPVIEALKTQQENWLHTLIGGGFGSWHGVSSILYLIIGLLGLWQSWKIMRLKLD